MITPLSEAECEITECVARKVNEVIEAVEGLQGQADAHEAMLNALQRWIGRVEGLVTGEGGQAADGAMPVEARGIPLTAGDILAVRRALSANPKVWAVTAKGREDGIRVFRVAVRNPTPEDDMAIINAHHDWLEAHPEKEFFDVSIDASWGDDEEDLPGMGGQAADGEALDLDAIISRGAALAECLYCGQRLSYEDEWQAFTSDIPALIWEVRSLRAERDEALARGAELEELYQAGQDYANARCQERSELVAEIDKWKAKAKALEPDAALGALVRRMQRRVIVERLRDGTYSVGLRGEPRVYFRDEERTFAWAADAALGEEATDAH